MTAETSKLRLLPAPVLRTRLGVGALLPHLLPRAPTKRLELIEDANGPDAGLRYLAYALPEREAVWWCCMCARHAGASGLPEGDVRAMQGIEQWVRQPAGTGRQALLGLCREADPAGPAAFAARAALNSRTSMRGNTGAGFSAAQSVARATELLQDRNDGLARFRASALDIAVGGAGWIETGPGAPEAGSR